MKIDILQFLVGCFNSFTEEQRKDFIERIACEDELIKHVADQIFLGCTENGCYAGTACTASSDPALGLDYAQRLFAKHTAAEEIKRLEEALAYREKECAKMHNEYCNVLRKYDQL